MLARTYRDPVAQVALIVDLIPVYAVLVLGWGAAPLVFLYWLENLVIGGVTIARMLGAGAMQGLGFLSGAVFLSLFFCVHYGMFCFGHGQFLSMMANGGDALSQSEPTMFTPQGLIEFALVSGPQMGVFVAIILGWQAFLYVYDYLIGGEAKTANIGKEMMAPYGRIIVLHVALFAGMFFALALGDPMLGVLGLILLRAIWGMFLSVRRRLRLDAPVPAK